MEGESLSTVSRQEAQLYHLLLRELGGGHGAEIKEDLGVASTEVYRAIWERLRTRARGPEHSASEIGLDAIDWSVIRALVPVVLRRFSETEFRTVTGFSLDKVRELGHLAQDQVREYGSGADHVSYRHGTCVVRLPSTSLKANVTLVGVPDAASWDRVMPDCAQGRRQEFLDAMQAGFSRRGEWHWEERDARTLAEIDAWVRSRRLEWVDRPITD